MSTPTDFTIPHPTKCWAFPGPTEPAAPFEITRRPVGPNDVAIEIKFAGICHSDIHSARDEWGKGFFPMVPGHEIGGVVIALGKDVKGFAIGDHAGVGCMVDSCRSCGNCRRGDEQYCDSGCVFTYNSKHKYCVETGTFTYGGYSRYIVVDAAFALRIPKNLDLAAATPLLCAGITTYSPFVHYDLRPNMKVAIAGLGGLGHVAVKFALAFGCHTTVLSRGTKKREAAINELKAHEYVDVTNPEELQNHQKGFDFILSTISAQYDVGLYINLLKTDGKLIVVGAPPGQVSLALAPLIFQRRVLGASLIGGIKETQDMLDFCGRHNITCDIELIPAEKINEAYERTIASDVKYRFVIDTNTI